MSQFETILLGVVAGVITAGAVLLLKEFWFRVLLPSYQAARYQGADISGSWSHVHINEEDNSDARFSLVLKQKAHRISGSMHFLLDSPKKDLSIDFFVWGEYWEGYLTLNARSKDRKAFSNGTMFLKLVGNGTKFEGCFSFRNSNEDVVTTNEIELVRK